MPTKSRTILATALVASAMGSTPALALDLRSPDAREGSAALAASDLRTPDARDRERVAGPVASDLRTPDARDRERVTAPVSSDLRSPDARDGGTGQVVQPVAAQAAAPASAGFDWTAAVIGAAGGLALAVLAGAGIALGRRRSPQPLIG